MPRNPQTAAMQRLLIAYANWKRAGEAVIVTRKKLDKAMIDAVESGITRYEVAKTCNVSQQRISQIPGMPPGSNTHKKQD
jgi:hypothetical protein